MYHKPSSIPMALWDPRNEAKRGYRPAYPVGPAQDETEGKIPNPDILPEFQFVSLQHPSLLFQYHP